MIAMDKCHEEIIKNRKPLLSYDETKDFDTWREQVREMLSDVLGDMPEERCDLNIRVEWEKEHETFYEKRILFTAEAHVDVPCHLWVPKNVKLPWRPIRPPARSSWRRAAKRRRPIAVRWKMPRTRPLPLPISLRATACVWKNERRRLLPHPNSV